jgi:hypothetical protein
MLQLANGGWAQWDNQIGTYRAEIAGVLYGRCAGDVLDPSALPEVTADEIAELVAERVAVPVADQPLLPSIISKAEFLGRWTLPETAAFLAAAKDNAFAQAFLLRVNNAESFDLRSQTVEAGLDLAVALGAITLARKAEILT